MWPFDSNKQQMYQQYTQAYNTGDYSNMIAVLVHLLEL